MTIIESLISGMVQGLTEFLPVSSSGHLVLVHSFFGFKEPGIFFDICLHAATLGAVLVYFGKDIISLIRERKVAWILYLGIGTVPAVIAALFFEKEISAFFTSPVQVAFMLIVTGLVLFAGHAFLIRESGEKKGPTFLSSILVGVAQAFALIPGISRSGMTISSALAVKMKPEEAFRFSFLLSVPAIMGAVLYKVITVDAGAALSGNILNYALGMLAAFLTGLIGLRFLWKVIRAQKLYVFGFYCITVGLAGIFFLR